SHTRGRDDREVPFDVDVVRRHDDGRLARAASPELLHRLEQLRCLLDVAVRRDRCERDHPSEAMRSQRSSRKRGASTSTPTCAFRGRSVTSQRSATVRPSQYCDCVSTTTLQLSVCTSVGSSTCATAIASWIG